MPATTVYRKISEMKPEELLAVLTDRPQFQVALFEQMGGDPADHNYARLSFLTRELRRQGYPVRTSRARGVWLGEEE